MSNASLLIELNAFRAAEGKAPYADFRVARHMPMLIEYRETEFVGHGDEFTFVVNAFEGFECEMEITIDDTKYSAMIV